MRSEQLAGLVVRAPTGVGLACRRIADVERAVAPDRMHDHGQLARHRDTGLAVARAPGERLAPAFDLVGALEARHQAGRRLVERAPHIRRSSLPSARDERALRHRADIAASRSGSNHPQDGCRSGRLSSSLSAT